MIKPKLSCCVAANHNKELSVKCLSNIDRAAMPLDSTLALAARAVGGTVYGDGEEASYWGCLLRRPTSCREMMNIILQLHFLLVMRIYIQNREV